MAYHHLAQGVQHGEPWLLSFSEISQTATSFVPVINDQVETFAYAGHYRGLPVLKDDRTQSIWHHITGTCASGEKQGQGLKPIGQVFHLKAGQVERSFPQAHIAISQPYAFTLKTKKSAWAGDKLWLEAD